MMWDEPSKRRLLRRQDDLRKEADSLARRLDVRERSTEADADKGDRMADEARWEKVLKDIEAVDSLIEAIPGRRLNLLGITGITLAVFVLLIALVLQVPLGDVWARVHASTNSVTISAPPPPIPIISGLRLRQDGFRVEDGPKELLAIDAHPQESGVFVERLELLHRQDSNSRIVLRREADGWLLLELYGWDIEMVVIVGQGEPVTTSSTALETPLIALRMKLDEAWKWPHFDWASLTTEHIASAGYTEKVSQSGLLEGVLHIDENDRTAPIFQGSFLRIHFGERTSAIDWLLRLAIAGMQPERESGDNAPAMERNSLEVGPTDPIVISVGNTVRRLTIDRRDLIPTRIAYLYAGDRLLFLISLLTGIAAILLLVRQVSRGKLG